MNKNIMNLLRIIKLLNECGGLDAEFYSIAGKFQKNEEVLLSELIKEVQNNMRSWVVIKK